MIVLEDPDSLRIRTDGFFVEVNMKNMKKKTIGIIGGMGPEASCHFYGMLISHAQKNYHAVKNEDFPDIYLTSIPVPDFISSDKNQRKALSMLIDKIKEMDKLNISFYCLACNTAHLLLDNLKKETNRTFISLLEEVPKYLTSQKIKTIGLLATPVTINTKLFIKELTAVGIKTITPDDNEINKLGDIIKKTIAGKNLKQNSIVVQKIAAGLLKKGAEGILESCTEIPLIFPEQHLVPVYDTLEILAQAVLKKYYLIK